MKVARSKKSSPSVIMWQGLGILYPNGTVLQAYSERPDFVLAKHKDLKLFAGRLKKTRLVMVTARLETVTRRQVLASAGLELGELKEKTRG